MKETQQTAFRIPSDLLSRIDAHADHLGRKHGFPFSRTSVVLGLIARALDAEAVETAAHERRAKRRAKKASKP